MAWPKRIFTLRFTSAGETTLHPNHPHFKYSECYQAAGQLFEQFHIQIKIEAMPSRVALCYAMTLLGYEKTLQKHIKAHSRGCQKPDPSQSRVSSLSWTEGVNTFFNHLQVDLDPLRNRASRILYIPKGCFYLTFSLKKIKLDLLLQARDKHYDLLFIPYVNEQEGTSTV